MQNLISYYYPPNKRPWQGRSDGPAALRMHESIELIDLNHLPTSDLQGAFGLLGFACDEGIRRNKGRSGAADGPHALRCALASIPMPQHDRKIFDCGNIVCTNANLEAAQSQLADAVALMLANKMTPIVMGGGHEVAWGHYQGITKAFPEAAINIVNCDSHFDLRPLINEQYGHSGSSFQQIADICQHHQRPFSYTCLGIQQSGNTAALFKKAESLGVTYLLADEFHLGGHQPALEIIDNLLHHSDVIYLTVCLDVFAAPFAPGVSAPQPLGLLPWHLIPIIKRLAASGKVIGFDIAELSPPFDVDQHTAKLAANLIYHYLAMS